MRPLSIDEYSLIVQALDGLHWRDSTSALKAMCLVQRSFVPLCQKILFSNVSYSPDKVGAFLDLVKASPHLADYIRELYFQFNKKTASTDFPESADTVLFLDKLHNVKDLRIISPESKPAGYDWKMFNPQVCDALLRLMHSPSVKYLALHRFQNFPLRGLLGLKDSQRLGTLDIAALEVDRDSTQATESVKVEEVAGSAAAAPAHLTKLTAYPGSAPALEVLVGGASSRFKNAPVFNFAGVREFYTEWNSSREAKASQSMIAATSYLEDLLCSLPKYSGETYKGLADAILKGPFKSIRELKFYTIMPEENEDDPFYGSVKEVTQLSGQVENLQSLTFDFHHQTEDAESAATELCRTIAKKCKVLDRVLSDRKAFPSLKDVSIYFIISVRDDPSYGMFVLEKQFRAAARAIKQQIFQNLKAAPAIKFSFQLEMEWYA